MTISFPRAKTMTSDRRAAALLLAACAVLAACTKEVPPPEVVVRPVKIIEIGPGSSAREQEYPGVVRATRSAAVGFEVPGRIMSLEAKEGQRVEPGDVLATIDDRDYVADLDVALANLRQAQANLGRSQGVLDADPGAITQQRIDSDRRAVEVAQARVAQARKAVDETVLVAPFSGVVSRRLVEVFENVQAKQDVLIVDNLEQLEVEVDIPERDIAGQSGQAGLLPMDLAEVTVQGPPKVRISALPGIEFDGRIVEAATRADAATRTFSVRIAFDISDNTIVLPGMTARVSAQFDSGRETRIPITALAATPDSQAKVWIVDPDDMTVSSRVIEIGETGDGYVEVLAGLEPGDLVATTGANQLAEGMVVSRFESNR